VRFDPDSLNDPLEDLLLAAAATDDTPRLLTVAEVASVLRVDAAWVYQYADLLGALRLGAGRQRPVRFEARTVAARLRTLAEQASPECQEPQPPVRRRRAKTQRTAKSADLLPVRPRLGEVRRVPSA
jgi:hypothetical protein